MNNEDFTLPKIGLAINVFGNVDFIECILEELKRLVCYVIIGFNDIHYNGKNKPPHTVLPFLEGLKKKGLVDEILHIDITRYRNDTYLAECMKRDAMAGAICKAGCEYQLIVDSDEIYYHDEFLQIIRYVVNNHIECSYIRSIDYYHDKMHYLRDSETYTNCLTKSDYGFQYNAWDKLLVDPTKKYGIEEQKVVALPDYFRMHHLCYVTDIKEKLAYYSQPYHIKDHLTKKIEDCFYNFHDGIDVAYGTAGQPLSIGRINEYEATNPVPTELPLVSVVVASFNSTCWLTESLLSVYQQTYRNVELVISDDCSDDNSISSAVQWAKVFGDRFTHIVVTKAARRKGTCHNLNNAMRFCTGNWIIFVSGHDRLQANCAERFIETRDALSNQPSKIIASDSEKGQSIAQILPNPSLYVCNANIMDFKGENSGLWIPFNPENSEIKLADAISERENLSYLSLSTIFVNRNTLIQCGGFDTRFPLYVCYPLIMNFLMKGERAIYINEALVDCNSEERKLHLYSLPPYQADIKSAELYYLRSNRKNRKLRGLYYHTWLNYWINEHRCKNIYYKLIGYLLRSFDLAYLKHKYLHG